jgi:hypothetical protein|tara:strand:+ start:180 stop:554 length:375 start_codon:yes stop_codon:yes gene_type:complete
MDNKENTVIFENNARMYLSYPLKLVYSSNVYTFASRNQLQLPERNLIKKVNSCSSDDDEDELDGIFYDVNLEYAEDEKVKDNRSCGGGIVITEKLKRKYGITGCFLSAPIPIKSPDLRSKTMLF